MTGAPPDLASIDLARVDLAIRGGRFLTGAAPVPDGSTLLISGSRIAGFAEPGAFVPARRTLDASGRLILPGLVNAHTHAAMSLFRGLADDLPLSGFLSRIWPAEAASVSPGMVYWCSLLSMAEMLLAGTTTLADSYFFEEEVARVATQAGMRAVCAQGLLDLATPDAAAGRGLERLEAFLESCPASELVRPAVFCHSVYTCSAATLQAARELARRAGCRFYIHLAETAQEQRECYRKRGATPLRLLDRLGVLGGGCVLVHAVHLDEDEIGLAAERGACVVHCPESNLKLASGIAPVALMLGRGLRVGLGTDGAASNNDLDMFGETASAARLMSLTRLDLPHLDLIWGGRGGQGGRPAGQRAGLELACLRMATAGGAQALGLECGELAAGSLADVVIAEPGLEGLWPGEREAQAVWGLSRGSVRTVVVGGRVVVEEGRLLTVDLPEVLAKVRELAAALPRP